MISLLFVPFKYFDVNQVAKQLKIRERRRAKSIEIAAEEPASGASNEVEMEMRNLGIHRESSSEEEKKKVTKNLKVYDPEHDEEFGSNDELNSSSHIEETFC